MRALQKLTRNGNATALTIPRALLHTLGWLPGESLIVEIVDDGRVQLRRPVAEDFGPRAASRMLPPQLSMVKP
jgi:antitoxin component of MazEF toxin-antitoxin module